MASPKLSLRRRHLVAGVVAAAFLVAVGGYALLAHGYGPAGTARVTSTDAGWFPSVWRSGTTSALSFDPTLPPSSGFVPIDMFSTPAPPTAPPPNSPSNPPARPTYHSTDAPFHPSHARPTPTQSMEWLRAKAAGRVALVNGQVVLLDPTTNPLLYPATGVPVPSARKLDLSWAGLIVEPPWRGIDAKGTYYIDKSYWNLCGAGASAVTLYYWQQLTGHPDVTGTAGYFLDPYAAEGVPWPSPGPTVAVSGGQRLGTYWSGSDSVGGYTAHGRGFLMYMAMQSHPPTWSATGIAMWADDTGHPYYPTRGSTPEQIQTGTNWEASGRSESGWANTWYGIVQDYDPTLARDLLYAVILDVGRDGVPVIAAVDTFDLPNWQDGSNTPHTRHAVSIVGYDNTANPPTFTYVDTCGSECNDRPANAHGRVYVIAQSRMVAALTDAVGMGFSW